MKKKIKVTNKKGVSLIVLIITVIVMVIIAGTIIMSLDNAGIIERSENAVGKYNVAEIKRLANVAWGEAYMNGARKDEEFETQVTALLNKQKVDLTPYSVVITAEGVDVCLKSERWVQQGQNITNGEITLKIGDEIAYDETNGGSVTGLTDTEWAVLGVNEKGRLLIMSTNDVVSSYRLGYETTMTDEVEKLQENQNDWLTGPAQLDKLCAPYSSGKGATSARSIRVEDINRIIGYAPETAGYGKGTLKEYNNEVKFMYNGTTKVTYEGNNGVKGSLEKTHSAGFLYYNGREFITINDLTTGKVDTVYAQLRTTFYGYKVSITDGEKSDLSEDTKAYKLLFKDSTGEVNAAYWLASSFIGLKEDNSGYGMRYIKDATVTGGMFLGTNLTVGVGVFGVRAVVTLASDVDLTGNSENGWSI